MKTHRTYNRRAYLFYLRCDGDAWTGERGPQFVLAVAIR